MKIVHISTSDIQGGAAKASFRLHQGLLTLKKNSSMYVAAKTSNDPATICYQPENRFSRRLSRALRRELIRRAARPYEKTRPNGFEHFRGDRTEFAHEVLDQLPCADVINLHWIADFVDYRSFFPKATLATPTVWTLHDMNPLTGGCHFDHSCGRFAEKCGCCPQLGSTRETDLAHQIWVRKKYLFEQVPADRLRLVAPSEWLATEARRSSIFRKFSTTVIPYGIDTTDFRPRNSQDSARRALEIPENAFVILFLAEYAENRRKGFSLLDKALGELTDRDPVFLLSLGRGFPKTTARIPHRHLGPIENDTLLSTIYSLADVFVVPSIQDNLPNTVLESMACGTPVVAFNTGGMRDLIADGETGCLVRLEDTHALAAALRAIRNDPEWRLDMSHLCRQTIVDRYSAALQATRYTDLYQNLLDRPAPPRDVTK